MARKPKAAKPAAKKPRNRRVKEETPVETKAKKVKRTKKAKVVETSDAPEMSQRALISQFLTAKIEKAENQTGMVANVAKYLRPQSTDSLCLDWLFNGGLFNGMTTVSGVEQSGKSTAANQILASGLRSDFLFSAFVDAEGTLNDEYFATMLSRVGIKYSDLEANPAKPFRYYKESVIENVFDYMVALLNTLPRKIWSQRANCWTYVFPKRDAFFNQLIEMYGVEPDKDLTTEKSYVCPTEYDGLEAAFYVDSFAAMLTERDEDEGERSKVRAAEATAFSNHLKRVASKLGNRGVLLFGVNQTRKIPGATQYSGPPTYQPGGEALKFYAAQRCEFTPRGSGYRAGLSFYDKKAKAVLEPSIQGKDMFDRYTYRHVKNTKNKMGNPNKETWMRIWIADHKGHAHGIDPVFDAFQYLEHTSQIVKLNRKKGQQNYRFNLKGTIGSKKAALLNAHEGFGELDFKRLILSEVYPERELIQSALDGLGLGKTVSLRKSLFEQIRIDDTIRAIVNSSKGQDETDYEADNEL